MKKITIAVVSAFLVLTITACGRRQDTNMTSMPTTQPTTMTILPDIDPTLETNIPDPEINAEIPTYTDGTDPTADMRSGLMNK